MTKPFLVLGIESSCDDTSAAVLGDGTRLLSNIVSSQEALHAPFGGVVPELASRQHIRNIGPVVSEALQVAGINLSDLDLVAVTRGPGLIGSLLVGLNYAKALAYALRIPLVGVNHLEGHFHSPFLEYPTIEYPLLCLIVSGGHSSLYHSLQAGHYRLLAGTRDDAAGESFDKVAKMLGLPYPGGPVIDRLAREYAGAGIPFNLPKISDGSLDFSFSGLKTAALQAMQREGIAPVGKTGEISEPVRALVKGFQAAVIRQLLHRVESFARQLAPRSVIMGGGVSCNSELRRQSRELMAELGIACYFPSPPLTTDNAAMIAYTGYKLHRLGRTTPLDANADTNLALGEEFS
ncbi:MAG: tRNA (adenosine(37)-N6)-threonylcarbamoyltransferase complex transferase subunit TsaD [Acidobacteria bacterium]|nr:tRNA (adenosine(37)-N6)-threonylcarbamoyltransferase complex transferase subunit TsaD [Acidobacteriota bacterium]